MSGRDISSGAVVCFGEMLVRLSSPGGEMLLQSPGLHACIGGAEANVAVSLARFGHPVRMVTTLPANALGEAARDGLRAAAVDTRTVNFAPGRMGLYFLTPGAVLRQSEIIYDRAGSAFAHAHPSGYDWPALLHGADWLHVSGVSLAVGECAGQAVLGAVRAAGTLGVKVSFDGNYRASMWQQRRIDGADQLAELMAYVDLAFADQRDIALILQRPELAQPEAHAAAIAAAFGAFPRLARIAGTRRVQHAVTRHDLSAWIHTRSGVTATQTYALHDIVDRIGSGDAFAAGVLHGLRSGWGDADAAAFGLAAAALKHGNAGDFNLATERQVLAVCEGGLDVRR